MKKSLILSMVGLMFLSGCQSEQTAQQAESQEEMIVIATTFYPLAEFARNVAGDKAEVIQIIPDGTDPHEYEPTPKDMVKINESALFLANGAHLDPWAGKIKAELEKKGIRVIVMADHVSLLSSDKTGGDSHDHHHDEEEDHHHDEPDPHFWLDPLNAVRQVEVIQSALISLDPVNSDYYNQKAEEYIRELRQMDDEYKEKLADCARNTIITSHTAFGYLAHRYGFEQVGISGISPQEEPSTRKIAELADMAKSQNVRYIFFEELASPRLAQTLASEVGAETLLLHPLGGLSVRDSAVGANYLTIMRTNLENLIIGLECG